MLSTTVLTALIIIHGEKPARSGDIHPAFVNRLEKALEIAKNEGAAAILITGGQTRRNAPAEADMGESYLKARGFSGTILKEREARSTSENILLVRKILEEKRVDAERVYIISSQNRKSRIEYLYKRLHPDLFEKSEFIGAPNAYLVPRGLGWTFKLKEFLLYTYQFLDPDETSLLATFVKYKNRNDTPPEILAPKD